MTTQRLFTIEPNIGIGLLLLGMSVTDALNATSHMLAESPIIYRHTHEDQTVLYATCIQQGLIIQFNAREQVSCIKLQHQAPVSFASKAIAHLSKMDVLMAYQGYPQQLDSLGTLLIDKVRGLGFDFNCKPFLQQVFVFSN